MDAGKKYGVFVEELIGKEYDSPLQGTIGTAVLGSPGFVESVMETHVGKRELSRDLPALRQLTIRPTLEAIITAVDTSRLSGSIEADEQKLLQGVFEFSDAEVREVMVPRSAVDALPVTATLEETKKAFRTLGYSRMPVYRGQLDNIVGIFYRRKDWGQVLKSKFWMVS